MMLNRKLTISKALISFFNFEVKKKKSSFLI